MVSLAASKKVHSEKHKEIFRQLLKEPANKSCVDCKTSTHPRWASWNLGCFICIRCSGIHRSMGTHISRVKSVDLDAWTDEQVESMVKWGNEKCNLYWEAKLPQGYIPDGSKIENFIRTKYDMKKWVSLLKVPDPMSMKDTTNSNATASISAQSSGSESLLSVDSGRHAHSNPAKGTSTGKSNSHLLLDDDFGSFSSALASRQPSKCPQNGTSTPVATSDAATPSHDKTVATPSATPASNQRTDLKRSILSLYSTPSSSSSMLSFNGSSQNAYSGSTLMRSTHSSPGQQSQGFNQPSASRSSTASVASQAPRQVNDSVAQLGDSLLGLDFGAPKNSAQIPTSKPLSSTPNPNARAQSRNPVQPSALVSGWTNEWSSIPTPENPWGSTSSFGTSSPTTYSTKPTTTPSLSGRSKDLEDDLYKNVWT